MHGFRLFCLIVGLMTWVVGVFSEDTNSILAGFTIATLVYLDQIEENTRK